MAASILKYPILLAAGLVLAACGIIGATAPREETDFAKAIVDLVVKRDFAAVKERLDPAAAPADVEATFAQMADLYPRQPLREIHVVGWNVLAAARVNSGAPATTPDLTGTTIVLRYDFANDDALQVSVRSKRTGERLYATWINFLPLSHTLLAANAFTASSKQPTHFFFLTFAVAIPVFIIATLFVCWRTHVPRRKWLWFIAITLCIGQLTIEWTTGRLFVMPLSITFFGFSFAQASPYASIVMSTSFPIGAILFWIRRRKWRKAIGPDLAKNFA